MLASHVKLSSEGQIIIPKEIRDSLEWEEGMELSLVATKGTLMLQTKSKKKQQGIQALRGMLQDKNISLSTEELCQPVDDEI